jgi:uncharacterized protein (TIGR02001 family)
MLTSIRSLAAATALAGAAFVATPALAQDAEALAGESGFSVSGNAAIVSDYRFRGVGLSGGDPAIQGGVDLGHDSGFYIGTWASSIDGGAYGSIELDLYGGFATEITPGVEIDVGLLYYAYPNGTPGLDLDYFEPYASISTTLGPVGATLGAAYAWDQDSLGGSDNLYIYTDFELGVPNTPLTITAHAGYTDGVLAPPLLTGLSTDDSGFDWSIGASATLLGPLSVGVSYVDTEGPSVDGFTDGAVVATLSVEI